MIPSQITLNGLAETSLLVSFLIAIFLPLRPFVRRVIGSQWLCVLWLALLMRLLAPWQLESRWGVFHRRQDRPAPVAAVAQEPVKIKVSFPKDGDLNDSPSSVPAAAPSAQAGAVAAPHWDFRSIDFWNVAWMGGASFGLAMLAGRWAQTLRLGAKTRPVANGRLRDIFEAIPKESRRNTRLRMTDAMHVPTLAGIFRPQIWMPESWPAQFTDEELRNVLLHELGHARRGDLIVQWLFAFAQCIHWFNPLVWVAARVARLDREMACDAWVLARNGADHTGYGAALMKTVQLLRSPLHAAPATVAMASSRRSLFARVSGIGAFRPLPPWRGMIGIAIMIAALALVTTRNMTAEDQPVTTSQQAAADSKTSPQSDGPLMNVSSWIFQIPEADWKKLCAENPVFKKLSPEFPELNREKPSFEEIKDSVVKITLSDAQDREETFWDARITTRDLTSLCSAEETQKMIWSLNQTAAVDHVVSYPAVLKIRAGTEANCLDSFEYNAGGPGTKTIKHETGLDLFASSMLDKNGGIVIEAMPRAVSFLGFLEDKNGVKKMTPNRDDASSLPVFSSTWTNATLTPIAPGQTRPVVFGCVRLEATRDFVKEASNESSNERSERMNERTWGHDTGSHAANGASPVTQRYVVLFFVTATIPAAAPAASSASAQPSTTPAHPATPATDATTAGNGSEGIALESKFVEITEEGWRKLCDANPMFKDYNAKLPELKQEKIAYADLKGKLTQGEKGSWEIPEEGMKQLAVLSKEEFEKMIGAFNQAKEVDLLSAPSVKTKDNQKAEIEAVVEFRYGSEWEKSDKPETVTSNGGVARTLQPPIFTPTAFATRNTGVTLEARPKINQDGSIDLNLAPSLVGFIGFLSEKDGVKSLGPQYPSPTGGTHPGQPVFSTSTGRITTTVQSGQTVLMGAVRLDVKKDFTKTESPEEHAAESKETVHNVLLVFVTAKIVKLDERAEGSDSPAAASSTAESTDSKIPDGIPVPGKEGFVTSPYSPDSGMIDVRGYEKGTEVRDPYSRKIFLVP